MNHPKVEEYRHRTRLNFNKLLKNKMWFTTRGKGPTSLKFRGAHSAIYIVGIYSLTDCGLPRGAPCLNKERSVEMSGIEPESEKYFLKLLQA